MLEIYKRIRARREELGISQEELAKRMGYRSRSSINKIENGEDKEIIDKGDNKVLIVPEHEAGRLITSEDSPRHFFSSRKLDEEGIDGIISEGRSGTSDYYTPRHKANLFFKVEEESNAVEEDKELLPAAQETKPADQDQTTPSTENKGL